MSKKKTTKPKTSPAVKRARNEVAEARESQQFLTVLSICVILLVIIFYFLLNR